jgi:hypothetical protein
MTKFGQYLDEIDYDYIGINEARSKTIDQNDSQEVEYLPRI